MANRQSSKSSWAKIRKIDLLINNDSYLQEFRSPILENDPSFRFRWSVIIAMVFHFCEQKLWKDQIQVNIPENKREYDINGMNSNVSSIFIREV